MAVNEKYVLVGGLEYVKWEDQQEPARRIDALDTRTGKLVASWHAGPRGSMSCEVGNFLWLGKSLYLVTESQFAQIDLNAIASRTEGWTATDKAPRE